jgi:hypothetical protein
VRTARSGRRDAARALPPTCPRERAWRAQLDLGERGRTPLKPCSAPFLGAPPALKNISTLDDVETDARVSCCMEAGALKAEARPMPTATTSLNIAPV